MWGRLLQRKKGCVAACVDVGHLTLLRCNKAWEREGAGLTRALKQGKETVYRV
jgi:hypothetical protein